ncbi:hypothetical protein [Streptomyces griseosporeus]
MGGIQDAHGFLDLWVAVVLGQGADAGVRGLLAREASDGGLVDVHEELGVVAAAGVTHGDVRDDRDGVPVLGEQAAELVEAHAGGHLHAGEGA